MIDKFAKTLVEKIRVDMNDLCDTLASGRVKSFEDYRYTCGILRGLAVAEEAIKDLAKRNEESDE